MAYFRSCVLVAGLALLYIAEGAAETPKFYPDDPIQAVPKPLMVPNAKKLKINALYDYFYQSVRQEPRPPVDSQGINTLGEVPDSAWFTNRHGLNRMTREQLQQGVGSWNAPEPPFLITGAKTEGITPGFRMEDAGGRLYFVKPDPIRSPELSTGADVVVSKFFHAIGYNAPENYIVKIRQSDWSIDKGARVKGIGGVPREMVAKDLYDILAQIPLLPDGTFRVVASLAIPGKELGPFRYEGTRSDDPNDIVPHELRRDLRGLFVFCAWLNHTDAKGANSYDTLDEEDGISFIRHYLIDFGSALGSDGDIPKDARFGWDYQIPSAGKAFKKILSLGFWSPSWERAHYPKLDAVGRIESQTFDPEKWKSNYPNPAFLSRTPGDEYWAAKIVMSFTDEDIRALVETGEYTDTQVMDYLAGTLAQRRDRIGKAYFSKVLPLDSFAVKNGRLIFEDLAVKYELRKPQEYAIAWLEFDNNTGIVSSLLDENSFKLPRDFAAAADGSYYVASIHAENDEQKSVAVYLRKEGTTGKIVSIERSW